MTEDSPVPDSLAAWIARYQRLAVTGARSPAVAAKIALHLGRFQAYFAATYGQDRLSACVRRDVLGWQAMPLALATVDNYLASLAGFTTWVTTQVPALFAAGNPCCGIGELGLGPLEPRALDTDQVRSLKSVCDRLPRFHQLRSQRWMESATPPAHHYGHPWRDRAIVFVLLSTGLCREELTRLDLDQVVPATAVALRSARQARINRVRGKGKTARVVFLSADANRAHHADQRLAGDYQPGGRGGAGKPRDWRKLREHKPDHQRPAPAAILRKVVVQILALPQVP